MCATNSYLTKPTSFLISFNFSFTYFLVDKSHSSLEIIHTHIQNMYNVDVLSRLLHSSFHFFSIAYFANKFKPFKWISEHRVKLIQTQI